MKGKLKRRW